MDFEFTAEQKLIRSSAKEFLEAEVPKDMVRELEEKDEGFPPGLWQKIADLGWVGLTIPEDYGGMGMGFLDLIVLLEEMGYNLLPGPFFSTVMGAFPIIMGGSEEQKRQYLPAISEGKLRLALALTEPTATYHPSGIMVEAVPTGDKYLIEGTKLFVESGHLADYLLCAVRTSRDERPEAGLTLFVIDSKTPGIQFSVIPTIGLEKQCEVTFANAEVPKINMVGGLNEGWTILEKTLQKAQVGKCAEMLGGMMASLDMTNTYVKKRKTYGTSVASYQVIQHYLADIWIDLETSRSITYLAASKIDRGHECGMEVHAAKAWVGEAFSRLTERCVQMHGAIGLTKECDIGLYYRNAMASDLSFGDAGYQRGELIKRLIC